MSLRQSSRMADSDGKNLRQNCRDRLLEMFRMVESIDSSPKVLIMDEFTVKTVSYSLKTFEVYDQHVCDLCNLYQIKQPMPSTSYGQQKTMSLHSCLTLLEDHPSTGTFLFFSSRLSEELKGRIMSDATLRGRMHMWEMNLEYLVIDSLGFITNNELALAELFKNEEDTLKGVACLNEMAARIATVFVSLKEYPVVRYRATKSLNATTMTTFRDLIPTKLAAKVLDCLVKYKDTNTNFFPQTETCELLILDRSIDQITPVIHEWTYDAMLHDLLSLPSKKELVHSEDDSFWLELRHVHIADVFQKLHERVGNCAQTMPAQIESCSRGDMELPTSKLANLVGALPGYIEQKKKLDLHTEIALELEEIIKKFGLQELGQLEQDLVVGDAGIKDVIKYLRSKDDTTRAHKLRLLMILASIYPEVFEGEKGHDLMKLAALQPGDMNAVYNVRLLGGFSNSPKSLMSNFFSKCGLHEKNRAVRKKHATEEETWKFSNFYPIIEELVEKLSKGELSHEDYPCLNGSSPMSPEAVSRRTRRPPTWAQSRAYDNGYTRDTSRDLQKGPRIFVFIAGGATRSELRVCHQLTTKLKRQIVLGSSSLDDPAAFITKMKLLKGHEDSCLPIDLLI